MKKKTNHKFHFVTALTAKSWFYCVVPPKKTNRKCDSRDTTDRYASHIKETLFKSNNKNNNDFCDWDLPSDP